MKPPEERPTQLPPHRLEVGLERAGARAARLWSAGRHSAGQSLTVSLPGAGLDVGDVEDGGQPLHLGHRGPVQLGGGAGDRTVQAMVSMCATDLTLLESGSRWTDWARAARLAVPNLLV